MEIKIDAARYAALLADAAFLRQVKDALEHCKSDAETITSVWAIIKDAEAIRSTIVGLK